MDFPSFKFYVHGFEDFFCGAIEAAYAHFGSRSDLYIRNTASAVDFIAEDLFLLYALNMTANEKTHLGWQELNESFQQKILGIVNNQNLETLTTQKLFQYLTATRLFSLVKPNEQLIIKISEALDLAEKRLMGYCLYQGRGHLALLELSLRDSALIHKWHNILYF